MMTHHRPLSLLIVSVSVIVLLSAAAVHASGSETTMQGITDSALGEIAAEGISVGGDLTNTCSTGSNAICVGTFEITDNHQFDSSDHKGAIDMSGYVQQNVSSEINVNQTQGSTATGVGLVNTPSISNSTLTLNNTNNATSFVGGF